MRTELTLGQASQIIKTTKHNIIETIYRRSRDHSIESVRVLTARCGAHLLKPDEGSFCLACDNTVQAQRSKRHPSFDRTPLDYGLSDGNENEALISSEALFLTSPYYCWYPLSATEGPVSPYWGVRIKGPGHIVTATITCWARGPAIEVATSWEALCKANLPEACDEHQVSVRLGQSFLEQRIAPFLFDIHLGAVVGVPLCAACIRFLEVHDTTGWRGYEV